MKVKILAGLECSCGSVMMRASRPYEHLSYCCTSACPNYGVFVEIPTFEVEQGKAFPPK